MTDDTWKDVLGTDPDKFWANPNRIIDEWSHFHEVARESDGKPHVICHHCNKVLVHGGLRTTGPSGMRAHLNSTSCSSKREDIQSVHRDNYPVTDPFLISS